MTLHVDFVQNDWDHAAQRIVGRVIFDGGLHVKDVVEGFGPAIDALVARVDPMNQACHPLQQLAALGAGGSYLTVLPPHTQDVCPFRDGIDSIPMRVEKIVDGILV